MIEPKDLETTSLITILAEMEDTNLKLDLLRDTFLKETYNNDIDKLNYMRKLSMFYEAYYELLNSQIYDLRGFNFNSMLMKKQEMFENKVIKKEK